MSVPGSIAWVAGMMMAVFVLSSEQSRAGQLSGTVNASYERSTHEAITNPADSIISPESTTDSKQSNILINYQGVLFSKNLMHLGGNFFIERDELRKRWNVRPIYSFDLIGDGYQYSGSYSPRSVASRQLFGDTSFVETRTYFRDWRNSLVLRYRKYPSVIWTYNFSRNFDNRSSNSVENRARYFSGQTNYFAGPASANLTYINSQNQNRSSGPATKDIKRTWQGTTGFAGTLRALGSFSASYSYLDSRASTQEPEPPPVSTTSVHTVSAMVASREWHRVSATASYSGRFLGARSANVHKTVRDENFSGQLSFAPVSYFSLALTKNYQITSTGSGAYQIGEYLALSAAFSRFLRRGLDTRANWTRTYIQKATQSGEILLAPGTPSGASDFSDALYFSLATVPYRRSKLLADLSVTRANRPVMGSPKYLSARSLSLSTSVTRQIDGRLSLTYANQGATLNVLHSYARSVSAGLTYLPGSSLNCNLTYTRNDINTTPHQSNRSMSGYVGYSFRNTYAFYLYLNRQRQEGPSGGTSANETIVRTPRSITAQLQVRLTPRSTLTASYITASAFTSDILVGRAHTVQLVYHGQF